jgi:hypothetical protein
MHEIYLFKLTTKEDVIAEYITEVDDLFILRNPMLVDYYDAEGLRYATMVKWNSFCASKEVTIPKNLVVFRSRILEEAERQYEKYVAFYAKKANNAMVAEDTEPVVEKKREEAGLSLAVSWPSSNTVN